MLTKADIPTYAPETIDLPNGWTAEIRIEDDDATPPWDREDGHGPVSDWRRHSYDQENKRPGERTLCVDGSGGHTSARYYDFAEAVRIARKDGWGCGDPTHTHTTKRAKAACAADRDFHFLRRWCADLWHYVGVVVTVRDADGAEVAQESVWGIEDDTDYWRQVAADLIDYACAGLVMPTYAADADADAGNAENAEVQS